MSEFYCILNDLPALPTASGINGELRVGDWVFVLPNHVYGCLVGIVTAIDKRGTPEHDTGNATDDIHVDFTRVDYPSRRKQEISESFRGFYANSREFDELPLEDVILSPDSLIRITGISLDVLNRLLGYSESAETKGGNHHERV